MHVLLLESGPDRRALPGSSQLDKEAAGLAHFFRCLPTPLALAAYVCCGNMSSAMGNPLTIAIFTASVSLVVLTFSIFAAAWLNQRNTERLVEALRQEMGAHLSALRQEMNMRFQEMDRRFEALEGKMEARFREVDRRFEALEDKMGGGLAALEGKMEARFAALEGTMNARFDTVASEIRRLDQRIEGVEKQLNQRMDLLTQNLSQHFDQIDYRFGRIEQRLDKLERSIEPLLQPTAPSR